MSIISIDEIYQKIDKAPIFKELAEKGKIIYMNENQYISRISQLEKRKILDNIF